MILDRLSENIIKFRQTVLLGIFLFLIVVTSFFSGEWNNWLISIFLILVFPLVFYTVLLLKDSPAGQADHFTVKSPYFYLILFLIVAFITSFFSLLQYNSWHHFSLILSYVAIFWVGSIVFRDLSKFKIIVLTIFFTGVLVSVINIIIFIQDPTVRAGGLLFNANALGGYFLFSLPLGIVLFLTEQRKKIKAIYGIFAFIVLISFFLTFSYTGWFSFLIPFFIILAVFRQKIFTRENIIKYVVIVLLLIISAIGFRYLSTGDLEQAVLLHKTIPIQGVTTSWDQRLNFLQSAFDIFKDNVWLGTGLSTFQNVYPRYALSVLEQPRYVHNYYLQTAAEIGIFGLLALLGFIVVLLKKCYQTVKDNYSDGRKKPYLLGLSLGVLGSAIHAVFDFGWQFPAVFLLFWLAGGLLLGQSRQLADGNSPKINKKIRLAFIGKIFIIILSLVLLARGVTLFLAQSYFERAGVRKQSLETAEALGFYEKAVQLDPDPDKIRSYAEMLYEEAHFNKELEAEYYFIAERYLQKSLQWNKNDYFIYNLLGRVYFVQGDYTEAEYYYQKAIYYDPLFHPNFYYNLTFLYFKQQEYDRAERTAKEMLNQYKGVVKTSNPLLPTQLAFLNLLLGNVYLEQGNKEQAKAYYQKALEIKPDFNLAKEGLKKIE